MTRECPLVHPDRDGVFKFGKSKAASICSDVIIRFHCKIFVIKISIIQRLLLLVFQKRIWYFHQQEERFNANLQLISSRMPSLRVESIWSISRFSKGILLHFHTLILRLSVNLPIRKMPNGYKFLDGTQCWLSWQKLCWRQIYQKN